MEQGCSLPVEGTQYEHLHMRLSAVDFDVKSKDLQIEALMRRVECLEEVVCSCSANKRPVLGTAVSEKIEGTDCVNSTARFDRNELIQRIWEIEAMSSGETSRKDLRETERELDLACNFIGPKDSINLARRTNRHSKNSAWVCTLQ